MIAYAGTIESTPPTSEPKNGAPSTTIATPSSAIAIKRASPPADPVREQSREQHRARRELRVAEVAEPGEASGDRRRVAEHRVELQPRAGRDVDEDQPDEDAERDDQRRHARPVGREPRDQRDPRTRRRTGTASTARAVAGRTGTTPARNVAARKPSSVSAASSIAICAAPAEPHERDQRRGGEHDLEHDEPRRDLRDLAVAELRAFVGVDHPRDAGSAKLPPVRPNSIGRPSIRAGGVMPSWSRIVGPMSTIDSDTGVPRPARYREPGRQTGSREARDRQASRHSRAATARARAPRRARSRRAGAAGRRGRRAAA